TKLILGLFGVCAETPAPVSTAASSRPSSAEILLANCIAFPSSKTSQPPVRSSGGMERFAETGRRRQLCAHRVTGNDHQHHDRDKIRQHREYLGIDLDAKRLTVQLENGHRAEKLATAEQAPRSPGRKHDEREGDPAAAGRHALGPQRCL